MRNFKDPAAAGSAAATPAAERQGDEIKAAALRRASDLAGYRKAGILADLMGGRLDANEVALYLDTAFGILRVRYVRQFSDGPWIVTGGSNPLDQRSFASTSLTVLYSKGTNDAR